VALIQGAQAQNTNVAARARDGTVFNKDIVVFLR
jgi:hypothetical protein